MMSVSLHVFTIMLLVCLYTVQTVCFCLFLVISLKLKQSKFIYSLQKRNHMFSPTESYLLVVNSKKGKAKQPTSYANCLSIMLLDEHASATTWTSISRSNKSSTVCCIHTCAWGKQNQKLILTTTTGMSLFFNSMLVNWRWHTFNFYKILNYKNEKE